MKDNSIIIAAEALREKIIVFLVLFIVSASSVILSQYPENHPYTLLPSGATDQIINASSGDLAMQHIYRLAGYNRPRGNNEYIEYPDETTYLIGKLLEYGIAGTRIEKFGTRKVWRCTEASLWEVKPGYSKIADFEDLPVMLAEGSESADVTAQLIWAGEGSPSFFEDNASAVKGKIVVTSMYLSNVHRMAMNAGALGTVSVYSPRALADPVQIPNSYITGGGFGFQLPPREGQFLVDRLLRHENITVRAKVAVNQETVNLHVPQCIIPGTDTTAGEVIFTAHLYEGLAKMGASDNASGSAAILEAAHLLNDLIREGRIEKPKRNIRFLWVQEISGTIPWVNAHKDLVKNALCNINLDMVGINLNNSKSFMTLYRSGFSNGNFVNDVMENYFRYTGQTNVEGITDELGRRGFSRRIVSPDGSDDPFYFRIMSRHESSDNAVFNDWSIGIPGVKMGTWPDNYNHSSADTPEKCDPTQLRRVIFIAAAGAYNIASAGDDMSIRILSEMYAGANTRLGTQMGKSTDMIWNASSTSIRDVYRRAVYNIEGLILAEKSAIDKVKMLSQSLEVLSMINTKKEKLDDMLEIQIIALRELVNSRAKVLLIPPVTITPDEAEKYAARIIPIPTDKAKTMNYKAYDGYISDLPNDFRISHTYLGIVNISEASGLADGKRNMLQIKKMIDAQFERESPLQDLVNYYSVLKEAGLMKF
jgi:aminopeptidase YwaD